MILTIILISIVSLISPAIALVIAIPFFSKISFSANFESVAMDSKAQLSALMKPLILFVAFQILFLVINFITPIQCIEIIVSIGLSTVIFAFSLYKFRNYEVAMLASVTPGLIYISLKNLLFFGQIKETITQSNAIVLEQMQNVLSPEMFEKLQFSLQSFSELMIKINPAIWLFSIVLGIFIGALLFSKKSENIKWDFKNVHFPHQLQLLVIIALLLFVLSYRVIGINLLLFSGFFYLIQGYSVLFFYIQQTLQKNRFLGILLLIFPIFSYFLLIALALIGIVDSWLDLRKFTINKGDKK